MKGWRGSGVRPVAPTRDYDDESADYPEDGWDDRYGRDVAVRGVPVGVDTRDVIRVLLSIGRVNEPTDMHLELIRRYGRGNVERVNVADEFFGSTFERATDGGCACLAGRCDGEGECPGRGYDTRCERCGDIDYAYALHRASGVETVCRECWMEHYGQPHVPVTLAELRERVGVTNGLRRSA